MMTTWKTAAVALAATMSFGAAMATAQEQSAPAAVDPAPAIEAPAATPEASATSTDTAALTAKDLPIGAAVFGADGAQIGEVNRVTSESNGAVREIHVTTGGKAGLNAAAVIVPANKISGATGGDGVKLSLSASEAKSLPAADNGAG